MTLSSESAGYNPYEVLYADLAPDSALVESSGVPPEVVRDVAFTGQTLMLILQETPDEVIAADAFVSYCAELDAIATDYPAPELWDDFRAKLSLRLHEAGRRSFAHNLLNTSASLLRAADGLYEIAYQRNLPALTILEEFRQSNAGHLSEQRAIRIEEALISAIVMEYPESPDIDALEAHIRQLTSRYDPLEAWLQTMQDESYDVEQLRTMITDDRAWGATLLRDRQHITAEFSLTTQLTGELSSERVLEIVDKLGLLRKYYPVHAVLDIQVRAVHQLIEQNRPHFALDIARAVTDDEGLGKVIEALLHHDFSDEALEIVARLQDPQLALYYLEGALSEEPGARLLTTRFAQLRAEQESRPMPEQGD